MDAGDIADDHAMHRRRAQLTRRTRTPDNPLEGRTMAVSADLAELGELGGA
jgi:hypothetical protein